MKLIKPSATLIQESDPWKKIEIIGRTCYKSEDKITEDSAKKFVTSAIKRKHFAILEHVRLTYQITGLTSLPSNLLNYMGIGYTHKVKNDIAYQYLTISMSHIFQDQGDISTGDPTAILFKLMHDAFIDKYGDESAPGGGLGIIKLTVELDDNSTTTISVRLLDNNAEQIIDYDDNDHNIHDSVTVKFVCDRGVTHELVRHRASFAQESTRYCNYTQGKFGGQITYVEPADYSNWPVQRKTAFLDAMAHSQKFYDDMIASGATPQEARAVLPNATKADIMMTMPIWQWKHFFNLRYFGTTGAPHPDMKVVAGLAYELMKDQL